MSVSRENCGYREEKEIAKGNLGVQADTFRSRELDYLAGEINAMSTSLAAVDRERRSQMSRAREIQQSLLPQHVQVAELRASSLFLPAEDVAGDYYDVIALDDGTDVICIADVTGHGVPAALNAMMLKVLMVEACERHDEPGEILGFINRRLTGVCRTDNFVTMFVAHCDAQQMSLRYANAGHESGLFLPAEGDLTELRSTGTLLGVVEDQTWTTQAIKIQTGDRLLLTTDGVTEAMNSHEQLFGREQLATVFKALRNLGVKETLQGIGDAVAEHCGDRAHSDDITLLVLEVTAESTHTDFSRVG